MRPAFSVLLTVNMAKPCQHNKSAPHSTDILNTYGGDLEDWEYVLRSVGVSEFGVLAVARFWTWIEGSCLNASGLRRRVCWVWICMSLGTLGLSCSAEGVQVVIVVLSPIGSVAGALSVAVGCQSSRGLVLIPQVPEQQHGP